MGSSSDAGVRQAHLAGCVEAAITELEAGIPYPLSQVVTDIEAALQRKSFHDRIAEKLASDPSWK